MCLCVYAFDIIGPSTQREGGGGGGPGKFARAMHKLDYAHRRLLIRYEQPISSRGPEYLGEGGSEAGGRSVGFHRSPDGLVRATE